MQMPSVQMQIFENPAEYQMFRAASQCSPNNPHHAIARTISMVMKNVRHRRESSRDLELFMIGNATELQCKRRFRIGWVVTFLWFGFSASVRRLSTNASASVLQVRDGPVLHFPLCARASMRTSPPGGPRGSR